MHLVFRLLLISLTCCVALQGLDPLVASSWKMLATHLPLQDQFPSDDSGLPVPLEESEIGWKMSDCDDEALCLFTLPSGSGAALRVELCVRNLSGFYSSKELLSTLHRLHI